MALKSIARLAWNYFGYVGPVTGASGTARRIVDAMVAGRASVALDVSTSSHPKGERIIVIGKELIAIA